MPEASTEQDSTPINNLRQYIHSEITRRSEGHWVSQVHITIDSHWGKSNWYQEPPFGQADEYGVYPWADWELVGKRSEIGSCQPTNERCEKGRQFVICMLANEAIDQVVRGVNNDFSDHIVVQFIAPSKGEHLRGGHRVEFKIPTDRINLFAYQMLIRERQPRRIRLDYYNEYRMEELDSVKQEARSVLNLVKELRSLCQTIIQGKLDHIDDWELEEATNLYDLDYHFARLKAAAIAQRPDLCDTYEDVLDKRNEQQGGE
tara:strand:- start:308 stop:1087 length:780 start_codon:yes stop_codon:yes gene_type:complete